MERILRNLLANAIDHSEGQPVELTMRGNADAVAISVRDHGVGLRKGEAELVFSRFWRADPSRNRRTGGTGLGLSISLEDARLHGGWLEAWGEPGHGAVFRLTLPRRHGEELRESPLPLAPAIQLEPNTVVEEPIADEEPGEIELRPEEITWQPAEPVDGTPADKAANEVSEEVR